VKDASRGSIIPGPKSLILGPALYETEEKGKDTYLSDDEERRVASPYIKNFAYQCRRVTVVKWEAECCLEKSKRSRLGGDYLRVWDHFYHE